MKKGIIFTMSLATVLVSCKTNQESDANDKISNENEVVTYIQVEDSIRLNTTNFDIDDRPNKNLNTTSNPERNVEDVLTIESNSNTSYTNNTLVASNMNRSDNGTYSTNNMDMAGLVRISGWDAFNDLVIGMDKLKGADHTTTKRVINELRSTVDALYDTRPTWMNTEEINEDIADFQKDYNEFLVERTANEAEYRENLEEISEQFQDLREEAGEVFNEYVNITRNAIEEYREEMKDDGDKADAIEEYNEEIKKLKKVRDGEKREDRK